MAQANVQGVDPQIQQQTDAFRPRLPPLQAEIAKAIVGHHDIVDGVLTCLFVGGHALLEGVPGSARPALIRRVRAGAEPEVQPHPVHAGPQCPPT